MMGDKWREKGVRGQGRGVVPAKRKCRISTHGKDGASAVLDVE